MAKSVGVPPYRWLRQGSEKGPKTVQKGSKMSDFANSMVPPETEKPRKIPENPENREIPETPQKTAQSERGSNICPDWESY